MLHFAFFVLFLRAFLLAYAYDSYSTYGSSLLTRLLADSPKRKHAAERHRNSVLRHRDSVILAHCPTNHTFTTMAKTQMSPNERLQLVPELRSPFARYPLDRPRWIRPTRETHTPKDDGAELTFIACPPPPKGTKNDVKMNYVWGPGSKGYGYYHLLTKESYVALSARMHSECAPPIPCCGGATKESEEKRNELEHVYLLIVNPRSKSPVPKDTYAMNHTYADAGGGFTPPENKQWKEIIPNSKGRVELDKIKGYQTPTTYCIPAGSTDIRAVNP